jgi:hypothetical protein
MSKLKEKDETDEFTDVIEEPKQKKITHTIKWFNEYCTEDKKYIKMICDLVADSVATQFDMHVKSSNTEVFALIFFVTFETILDFLKQKQSSYDNFSFIICKCVNIGYNNNTDTENEKVGNFMPVIEYMGINRNIIRDENNNADDKSEVNFIRWKQQNLTQNENYCNQVQNQAALRLASEYGVQIVNNEAIIPIFCIFFDMIVEVIKAGFYDIRAGSDDITEFKINVLGLFDAYYSFDPEKNVEAIDYLPGIYTKLREKSDMISCKE